MTTETKSLVFIALGIIILSIVSSLLVKLVVIGFGIYFILKGISLRSGGANSWNSSSFFWFKKPPF
jgi:hypothetical protein